MRIFFFLIMILFFVSCEESCQGLIKNFEKNALSKKCLEGSIEEGMFIPGRFVCPTGYALVLGNSQFGTNDFCVSKFEMKNVNNVATAQPELQPWVSISQSSSKSACTNLNAINGVTDRYDLISNPEWMTIAFEIEKTASNWSGKRVGSGILNRGQSDNSPSTALAVTDINDSYNGTGNSEGQGAGSGWEQKRTHILLSREVIWDFAGNVWEHVDWTLGGSLTLGPNTCNGSWTQFPNVSCGELFAADYLPGNPSGESASTYNSSFGLGQFYGGNIGAAMRGGANGPAAGIFTLSLIGSAPYSDRGFRCVYRF